MRYLSQPNFHLWIYIPAWASFCQNQSYFTLYFCTKYCNTNLSQSIVPNFNYPSFLFLHHFPTPTPTNHRHINSITNPTQSLWHYLFIYYFSEFSNTKFCQTTYYISKYPFITTLTISYCIEFSNIIISINYTVYFHFCFLSQP